MGSLYGPKKKSSSFLKKEPKNFCESGARRFICARPMDKNFLLLFYKKEALP